MTTLTATRGTRTARSAVGAASLSGWAGIAFVPVFVVGALMASSSPDTSKAGDAKVLAWYADAGHRTGILVGGFLLIAAALLFLVFAAGLLERLHRSAEGSPVALRVAGWAAPATAVLMMAGAVEFLGIPGNRDFGGTPIPQTADVLRQNLGFPYLFVVGGISAALFIAAVTTAASRAGLCGGGMVATGYILAVILCFAIVFLPMVALPIWVAIAAINLLRQPHSTGI